VTRTLRSNVLALALLVLVLAGCGADPNYIFVEGFEEACDGAPCRWTVQSSTPGAARWNETTPGEHGVLLEGNPLAIIRDMSGVEIENPPSSSIYNVEIAARCDGTATLTIEMSVEALASGSIETFTASVSPPSDWDGTLDSRELISSAGGFGVLFRDIVGLRVVKVGDGACELDYLAVRADSGFSR